MQPFTLHLHLDSQDFFIGEMIEGWLRLPCPSCNNIIIIIKPVQNVITIFITIITQKLTIHTFSNIFFSELRLSELYGLARYFKVIFDECWTE